MLVRAVCTSCLYTQTKWNQNLTSQESNLKQKAKRCPEIKSQVEECPPKDDKVMPRNQKPKGIDAKHDFPVPLILRPGRVSVSSLFH